jgi:hypothetical protein
VSGPDLGASVSQRLLNQSREQNRPFQELLQYLAMERFLYRVAKSQYADRFIPIGQSLDPEVLPKLAEQEIVAAEVGFPVAIGAHLVDHDRAMFSTVPGKISLSASCYVEPARHPAAFD